MRAAGPIALAFAMLSSATFACSGNEGGLTGVGGRKDGRKDDAARVEAGDDENEPAGQPVQVSGAFLTARCAPFQPTDVDRFGCGVFEGTTLRDEPGEGATLHVTRGGADGWAPVALAAAPAGSGWHHVFEHPKPDPDAPLTYQLTVTVAGERVTGKGILKLAAGGGVIEHDDVRLAPRNPTSADPCDAGPAGGLIDFESLPDGGVLSDGMEIGDQYLASHGVSFALEGGGRPKLAAFGAPLTAFSCDTCPTRHDMLKAGESYGRFFLTDDGVLDRTLTPVLVSYATPVASLSGVMLDPDGDEIFTIEARDAAGATVATALVRGDGARWDGRGVRFEIVTAAPIIASLRLSGRRGGTAGIGIGFDDFSPAAACRE